jgi:5-hydroxyisourate hydrolase / 2-oxo-4-hydroxy-4-carboxy-5-ureidoimidazoline decarboxylase
MTLSDFNKLSTEEAAKLLFSCCGSITWVNSLLNYFPFQSEKQLVDLATDNWYNKCTEEDWRLSFKEHPKIGDVKSLTEKFAGKEQASITQTTADTINNLAIANTEYENKFGFIFIVCATGKSAEEMLALLQDRLQNSIAEELNIAMGEQQKITIIRFKKLLPLADFSFLKVSQITTHVLDTSVGLPGKDICIRLKAFHNNEWQTIAQGITNADGRIPDLLPSERNLIPACYKMVFNTGAYYASKNIKTFYPEVEIMFNTFDDAHYHVPLLLNPFGYSTYRGS